MPTPVFFALLAADFEFIGCQNLALHVIMHLFCTNSGCIKFLHSVHEGIVLYTDYGQYCPALYMAKEFVLICHIENVSTL